MGFCFTVFQLAGGFITDKFGIKKTVVIPTVLSAPAFILAGVSKNWQLFVLSVLALEIFAAVQWPAFMLAVSESSEEEKGFAYSIFEFAILASFTAGPALAVILLPVISLPKLIIIGGVVNLATAVVRQLYLKDFKKQPQEKFNFGDFWGFFNAKIILLFPVLIFLGFALQLTLYGPFIAMYSKDIFSFSERHIQFMIFMGNLFGCVFSFAAGYLVDKYGSKAALSIALAGQGLFFLLWTKSAPPAGIYFYFILGVLFLQCAAVAKNKFIIDALPEKSRGFFMGLFFAVSGAVASSAPIIGSYAKKLYGSGAPFSLNFIVGCLAIILILLYSKSK